MRKNLNLIVLGTLAVGFCLSLALCFVLFAKLSRIDEGVRMAEERLRALESSPVTSPPESGRASGADIEIARWTVASSGMAAWRSRICGIIFRRIAIGS